MRAKSLFQPPLSSVAFISAFARSKSPTLAHAFKRNVMSFGRGLKPLALHCCNNQHKGVFALAAYGPMVCGTQHAALSSFFLGTEATMRNTTFAQCFGSTHGIAKGTRAGRRLNSALLPFVTYYDSN